MNTKNKIDQVVAWVRGDFGNRPRAWNTLAELQASEYRGTLSIRSKLRQGGGRTRYNVPYEKVDEALADFKRTGTEITDLYFGESADDRYLLCQGEIWRDRTGWHLAYNTEQIKMIEAMQRTRTVVGARAFITLQHYLNEASLHDLLQLFEQYPQAIVEFGAYSMCWGSLTGRNTIVWEVREY